MANSTKKALESSLKKLLKEKPFDKITIADLTGAVSYTHLQSSCIPSSTSCTWSRCIYDIAIGFHDIYGIYKLQQA